MLSQKMTDQLNKQINLEFYSANLYLQMSAWASFKGLDGCAKFLLAHSQEEMEHMHRLFTYVNETGALAKIGTIDEPASNFENIGDVFEIIYAHECEITEAINKLVDTAHSEKDYSTFNFLQWYVAEQHQEEHLFKSVLDKIKIIGDEGQGPYLFDQELSNMAGNTD